MRAYASDNLEPESQFDFNTHLVIDFDDSQHDQHIAFIRSIDLDLDVVVAISELSRFKKVCQDGVAYRRTKFKRD